MTTSYQTKEYGFTIQIHWLVRFPTSAQQQSDVAHPFIHPERFVLCPPTLVVLFSVHATVSVHVLPSLDLGLSYDSRMPTISIFYCACCLFCFFFFLVGTASCCYYSL